MARVSVGIDVATLTRREFLGAAGAAGVTALLPWDRAMAQSKVNLGYMKIGDLSPLFMALEKQFFKDAGVEVNLAAMVGGAEIQPALASGAINIGWTNVVSMGQGHAQGFDFRFVANGAINKRGTNDVFGFLVRPDSPIKSAKELEGKTVATNNVRNIIHAAGLHWIDANGGDSSKVKWVEIPFPQIAPALVNKQIDAFVAVEPFVTVPTKVQKQARVLGYMLGGIAPRLLIASYFGSEAWIGKNVETVKAFVSAINRGIDAHNANLDEARAMIAKYTGLKPEFLKEMPLPAFEKKLLVSDIEPMLEVGVRYKFIDKKVPAGELISRHVQV